jgi:hypothetical protein
MKLLNLVILIIIIIALLIIYQTYLEKQYYTNSADRYNSIRKYLLKESELANCSKPILWIHIPYEYNARHWQSFGSRSSTELNQPYLYLTTKSIIKFCDRSFNIVFIDDSSFKKLIPGWKIDLNYLANPVLEYTRELAIAKLLYYYGGISVPISFLCFRNLIGLYRRGTANNTMFLCESVNQNITSTSFIFYCNTHFMGCKKENHTMKSLINFMERTISSDYTSQEKFLGEFDRWCNKRFENKELRLVSGMDVGVKTTNDQPVTVDTLLSENYINFYSKMYGIWIPSSQMLKRSHYEWFARMSTKQIFQSHFILAKYFVLALAPDSHGGVIEPLSNAEKNEDIYYDPSSENPSKGTLRKFLSFWRVPSGAPIWGPQPTDLGDNVPMETY